MDLMLYAAAKAGSPLDWTPFVGLFGAVIGATIALLGQRMNIKEQRRKDLRERVVDFLRAADELGTTSSSYMSAVRERNTTRAENVLISMRPQNIEIDHRKQYLDLSATFILRYWVNQLHAQTVVLCGLALKRGQLSRVLDSVETSAAVAAIDAKFEDERAEFERLRTNLVHYMRPDIDVVPLWARKPWSNIWGLLLHPFTRRPKVSPNDSEPSV